MLTQPAQTIQVALRALVTMDTLEVAKPAQVCIVQLIMRIVRFDVKYFK